MDVYCLGSMCCQSLMRPRGVVENAWQTTTGEEGNLSLSPPTLLKTTSVTQQQQQQQQQPPPPVITPDTKLQTLVSLFLMN